MVLGVPKWWAMSPLLAFALRAATAGGKRTLAYFQTAVDVERKADTSPVTRADRECEEEIRRMIATEYPDHGILGEEHGESGDAAERWVIDPIDGTKSFISGVPLYGTLLSFEVDHNPILGVCYFPALDEIIYAEAGEGAFFNGRPVRVSNVRDLGEATMVCGSPGSMRKHGRESGWMSLVETCRVSRTWGDAYGHALVATGRADLMIDPIVEWYDLSAMKVIVEEAGGRFSDFGGQSGIHREAISTNGHLHAAVLERFAV